MRAFVDTTHNRRDLFFHYSSSSIFETFFSKKEKIHISEKPYTIYYSDNSPHCHFTGKEKDEETGYGYFGARYMDHELMTMWLSVDPMADKYPSISPYAYCAWNPIKLVDPDGKDVWEVDKKGRVKNTGDQTGGKKNQTVKYANGNIVTFSGECYKSVLEKLIGENVHGASLYKGDNKKGKAMAIVFLSMAENTDVEWKLDKTKEGGFILSTLHENALSASAEDLETTINDILSTIHSHPSAKDDYISERKSMGLIPEIGYWGGDYGLRTRQPERLNSFVYMKNSHRVYMLHPKNWPTVVGDNKGEVRVSSAQQILQILNFRR